MSEAFLLSDAKLTLRPILLVGAYTTQSSQKLRRFAMTASMDYLQLRLRPSKAMVTSNAPFIVMKNARIASIGFSPGRWRRPGCLVRLGM